MIFIKLRLIIFYLDLKSFFTPTSNTFFSLQLAEFRKLHEDPNLIRRLESNFRPSKPIEDRIITYRSESGQALRN